LEPTPATCHTHRRSGAHDRNDSYQKTDRLAAWFGCIHTSKSGDEAMHTINRRALVAGAASAAGAIPALAQSVAAVGDDPVFAVIEAYQRADDAFYAQVKFEDDSAEKEIKHNIDDVIGRTPEMVRAVEAMISARTALAETVPTTLAGVAAVLRFVREQSERLEDFFFDDSEECTCFVASLEQAALGLMERQS
jgi:hypothetical protein